MILSLVVAFDENLLIGNNGLPWKIPADLKRFKAITMGNAIVMGSNTYKSIGKPLPGRMNIILTRNKEVKIQGCFAVSSVSEAINLAEQNGNKEIFFIGGATVYKLVLPIVQRLYITRISALFEGNAFFPDTIYWKEWDLLKGELLKKGKDTDYELFFQVYERKMQ